MKTVVVLTGLLALAVAELTTPVQNIKTKKVDTDFIVKQKKLFGLLENVYQVNHDAEYYKIGTEWHIEENLDHFTKPEVIHEFTTFKNNGFLPKDKVFSIFYEHIREETIALFKVLYYAKDFDTFYKTAAACRVYLNPGQFLYVFYTAVLQKPDTQGFVLPAPYEMYPELFLNIDVINKLNYVKEQEGVALPTESMDYGLMKENGKYVFYSNYSSSFVFNNEEQRLAYFTEDVGLNSYYYWFHAQLPFWWNGDKFGPFKERRGEIYYFFYKQLLNRYYFERMTNGLGPVKEFSWFSPITTGYYPLLADRYSPFVQRPEFYNINVEDNYENILFVDGFEKSFLQFLENGRFKAFDQEVDFHDPKTLNFVGNFWQYNADLLKENFTKSYQKSYEVTARHLLSAAPKPMDKYTFLPSALDFYQTSMRDPAFYQLYNRIINYIIQFKKQLSPYKTEKLAFKGVEIKDVKVDKLVTFFDLFEFNVTNGVFFSQQELSSYPYSYVVRQPRLNHKDFSVKIDLKSEVETDAVFKVFLGPKYDSKGYPITMEDNWNHFLLLDWFTHKIMTGENEITRNSNEFYLFKEDSLSTDAIVKMVEGGYIPKDMSEEYDQLPERLMLPKGTKDGFPFQFFVMAYPHTTIPKEYEPFEKYVLDNKPLSYPFDRPVYNEYYFKQPNMFFKDVSIYHEGEMYPYKLNTPSYFVHHHTNEVPK